ncbi:hypothetical protein [Rossellomorea vietnamensis]|jgi:hypothetical protein|uniref:hypothetical protein n=1 Tax=Rossellomorea vietnamensis TaxID=218284 RepID=UPI001E2D97DE|nr:hypothetical protein [Rossellomorea vietnamensis]MCC5800880.1 hypothetical protein [Rossellomorea vietnamensis]
MRMTKVDLMTCLLSRDQHSFKRFYQDYERFMFRTGYRVTGCRTATAQLILMVVKNIWDQPTVISRSPDRHLSVILQKLMVDHK